MNTQLANFLQIAAFPLEIIAALILLMEYNQTSNSSILPKIFGLKVNNPIYRIIFLFPGMVLSPLVAIFCSYLLVYMFHYYEVIPQDLYSNIYSNFSAYFREKTHGFSLLKFAFTTFILEIIVSIFVLIVSLVLIITVAFRRPIILLSFVLFLVLFITIFIILIGKLWTYSQYSVSVFFIANIAWTFVFLFGFTVYLSLRKFSIFVYSKINKEKFIQLL